VAKIADLAKANGNSFITIEGHTDASGNPAKNKVIITRACNCGNEYVD
jgi:outer membrane protein OmpA-like peptidoglycan-associated protein